MVGNKVKYTCKNCGWFTEILEEWSDLKPRRCMNKKCNTSFLKHPNTLITEVPVKQQVMRQEPEPVVEEQLEDEEELKPRKGKKNE